MHFLLWVCSTNHVFSEWIDFKQETLLEHYCVSTSRIITTFSILQKFLTFVSLLSLFIRSSNQVIMHPKLLPHTRDSLLLIFVCSQKVISFVSGSSSLYSPPLDITHLVVISTCLSWRHLLHTAGRAPLCAFTSRLLFPAFFSCLPR